MEKALQGNLVTPPRWSRGDARRFVARHLVLLLGGVITTVFGCIWADYRHARAGSQSADIAERLRIAENDGLADCEREVNETRMVLKDLVKAHRSRSRLLSVLVALSESLPSNVWILSVVSQDEMVRFSGRAESESALRDTLMAIQKHAAFSGAILSNSEVSATSEWPQGSRFAIQARLSQPEEG